MSKAIEDLMHEHRVIELVLAALERCAAAAKDGKPVDRSSLRDFVEFFRNFADRCHHGKEEDRLFQAMIQHGFPKDQGPIAVMLMEHTAGREHVGALAALEAGAGPLNDEERRILFDHARDFAALLGAHIQKEDTVLYPMAVRALPAAVLSGLETDFATFEKKVMGEGAHEKYHELAHRLAERFPSDPASESASSSST
ncbi:MAG: hemerythrin [Acidobacteria bacterium]|nr:hemerythrin [Acidobacteriota bacterium]